MKIIISQVLVEAALHAYAHGLSVVARSRGYPLVVVQGFLVAVASPVMEHGL